MAKILLVEDDLNLQEIYSARLSAEGHTVETASDGESALARAVQFKPDLVLLDVMMPKISGFDVLDIIRQTPEVKDTKVIILTALGQDSDKDRGEKLGADKYLIKSQITLEDVIKSVEEIVGSPNGGNKAQQPQNQASQTQTKPQQPKTPDAKTSNQKPQQPKATPTDKPAGNQQAKPNQEVDLPAGNNQPSPPQTPQTPPAQPPTDDEDTPPPAAPGTTVKPQQ